MPNIDSHPIPDLQDLTPRELEVLKLIADGYSLLEIAYKLQRSLKTVESHRLSLGRKLNVSDRVDLTKIAIAKGLASLEPRSSGGQVKRVSDSARDKGQRDGPTLHRIYQISDRIDRCAGLDMLKKLTQALCDVCEIEHAGVSMIEQGEDAEDYFSTMAYSREGQVEDLISYAKRISPCAKAFDDGSYVCEKRVAEAFPEDDAMVEAGAEFYVGLGLHDKQRQPIGVIWVAHGKTRRDAEQIESVIRQFVPRVSATLTEVHQSNQALRLCEQRERELEQLYREAELQNQHLDQIADYYCMLAERMSDGLIILDEDYAIKYVNQKGAEILGDKREQFIGRPADELLTDASRDHFRDMQPQREADEMGHYRVTVARPGGEQREVFVAPRSLFDESGHFSGSFAVLTDMKDVRHAKSGRADAG